MENKENHNATITDMFAYRVYMLATKYLAHMIQYPSSDGNANVKDDVHDAMYVRKRMAELFPSLLDSDTKRHCDKILESASIFCKNREEAEAEALRRKHTWGKVTLEDIMKEAE